MEGKHKDESEVRAALRDIAEQGARAGEIITEMRAMLKKDPGKMEPNDINLIVRTVMEMVGSDLVMRHVTSKLRLDPTLPLANCHAVQLRQVVLNLVMNGWESMAEVPAGQRKLTIESRRAAAGEIEVSVSDTGCGFSEEMLRQPFESFRTTKAKGLGLGLAICRSIITTHEGRLELANNTRGGATVKFTLPVNKRSATVEPKEFRSAGI
jgi:C4-dicarboxylate-specific signal transduction histidine kinase